MWIITKIKALLSSIFDFLFFLHSAQINSLVLNFYGCNLPIKMCEMSFKKLFLTACTRRQAYHLGVLLQKLECCVLQRLRRESRFPFNKKYFIFLKWFWNSSEGLWKGKLPGKGLREDSSQRKIQPVPLLQTKNFRQKMHLNFSWNLTVSSIIFITSITIIQ